MDESSGKLIVYFEVPFWIGVFEKIEDGKLSVCKVTFGAEPKDYEVREFVLHHYYELKFNPAVKVELKLSGIAFRLRRLASLNLLPYECA